MAGDTERFATLDGIRAVACFLVVAYHAPDLFPWVPHPNNAYLAVDLFFCLSGFVIARTYGERLRGGELSPGRFLLNRAIRFYPLYLVGLVLGAMEFVYGAHGMPGAAIKAVAALLPSLVYLPSPTEGPVLYPLDPPAWSLAAELAINWLYAWQVRLGSAVVRLSLPAASLAAVLVLACTYGSLDVGGSHASAVFGLARASIAFSLGQFIAGIAPSHRTSNAGALACCALSAVVLLYAPAAGASYALLVALVLSPAIVYTASTLEPRGVVRVALREAGRVSYGVYVLQAACVLSIHGGTTSGSALVVGLAVIVWFLERYYVPPMRRVLRGLAGGVRAPVSAR